MGRRQRVIAYGSAAALVVVGAIGAAIIADQTADIAGWALVTLGLGAIVLLAFYEIGLSEDRELAKEAEQRRRLEASRVSPKPPPRSRRSGAAWRSGRRG